MFFFVNLSQVFYYKDDREGLKKIVSVILYRWWQGDYIRFGEWVERKSWYKYQLNWTYWLSLTIKF